MPNTNDIHIDVPLVRELIKAQFPEWASLKIKPVEFSGWIIELFISVNR